MALASPTDRPPPNGKADPAKPVAPAKRAGRGGWMKWECSVIGSADGVSVQLRSAQVSPLHCAILKTSTGYELWDLGGTGGTFVNGRRIQRCRISDGDRIEVGPFRLRFRGEPGSPGSAGNPVPSGRAESRTATRGDGGGTVGSGGAGENGSDIAGGSSSGVGMDAAASGTVLPAARTTGPSSGDQVPVVRAQAARSSPVPTPGAGAKPVTGSPAGGQAGTSSASVSGVRRTGQPVPTAQTAGGSGRAVAGNGAGGAANPGSGPTQTVGGGGTGPVGLGSAGASGVRRNGPHPFPAPVAGGPGSGMSPGAIPGMPPSAAGASGVLRGVHPPAGPVGGGAGAVGSPANPPAAGAAGAAGVYGAANLHSASSSGVREFRQPAGPTPRPVAGSGASSATSAGGPGRSGSGKHGTSPAGHVAGHGAGHAPAHPVVDPVAEFLAAAGSGAAAAAAGAGQSPHDSSPTGPDGASVASFGMTAAGQPVRPAQPGQPGRQSAAGQPGRPDDARRWSAPPGSSASTSGTGAFVPTGPATSSSIYDSTEIRAAALDQHADLRAAGRSTDDMLAGQARPPAAGMSLSSISLEVPPPSGRYGAAQSGQYSPTSASGKYSVADLNQNLDNRNPGSQNLGVQSQQSPASAPGGAPATAGSGINTPSSSSSSRIGSGLGSGIGSGLSSLQGSTGGPVPVIAGYGSGTRNPSGTSRSGSGTGSRTGSNTGSMSGSSVLPASLVSTVEAAALAASQAEVELLRRLVAEQQSELRRLRTASGSGEISRTGVPAIVDSAGGPVSQSGGPVGGSSFGTNSLSGSGLGSGLGEPGLGQIHDAAEPLPPVAQRPPVRPAREPQGTREVHVSRDSSGSPVPSIGATSAPLSNPVPGTTYGAAAPTSPAFQAVQSVQVVQTANQAQTVQLVHVVQAVQAVQAVQSTHAGLSAAERSAAVAGGGSGTAGAIGPGSGGKSPVATPHAHAGHAGHAGNPMANAGDAGVSGARVTALLRTAAMRDSSSASGALPVISVVGPKVADAQTGPPASPAAASAGKPPPSPGAAGPKSSTGGPSSGRHPARS